jgi:hypothetical protein
MSKIRYYTYEILSASLGLALLAFFGVMSFFPMEIMLMGEGQTWYWTFIMLGFGIFIVFILQTRYKKISLYKLIRVADIFTTIFAIFVVTTYLNFTKDLLEPWIIQAAWFLRYNGFIIGILLLCVIIKTTSILTFLISKFNEHNDDVKQESKWGSIVLFILIFSFTFFILEVLLFRFNTLLSSLLSIFIIQVCLLSISLPFLSSTKVQKELVLKIDRTKKRTFLWLLVPLIGMIIIAISAAILYFFNPIIPFTFMFADVNISVVLPIVQLVALLLLIVILFILIFTTSGARAHRKYATFFKRRKAGKVLSSTFGVFDGLKIFGLILVFSQVLYYYDYPIYFPIVISMYLLFAMFGAVIYYILGRTQKIKHIIFITSILILIYNFYLTYIDGIYNVENNWSGSYDISFPFDYLHSWVNFALVGIPMGIIFSEIFLTFAFKDTEGTDSTNRALLLSFSPFMLGLIMMPGAFLLNNPGGDPTPTLTFEIFFWFSFILGIILASALIFHILTEILVPWVHHRRTRVKRTSFENGTLKPTKKPQDPNSKDLIKRKTLAINIAIIVVISTLGGFFIYYTYRETYKKPLLAYSPGNYYIWLQNSSERVSKNIEISVESSPLIDAIDIYLARNEYEAFQLVWRPLGPAINSMSYQISDFIHQVNKTSVIGSGNCSLRLEEYVIEEEFPDVLIPFSTMNLDKSQNYIFWFSLKTPYDALSGEYRGNISFNFNAGKTEVIDIHLNVWNFTIPKMKHLRTNIGGQSTDMDRISNYIYHRINDYGVPIRQASSVSQLNTNDVYTCWLNESYDTWVFNWTWWDNKIEFKINNSMNAFYLGYPYGWGGGPSGGRDPPIEDNTKIQRMKNWLTDVQDHMENKSWLNYSYIYFIDEFAMFIPEPYTRAEYFNRLKIMLGHMKDAAPKIKIMTTTAPSEELELVRDYIDIYCPIGNERDKERWDERMELNTEFWFYMCVGPMAPWPNSHLYNRLYETRIQLWQVWLYNIHGFLYWSSTSYYHGHHGLAYNGYGDGWFLYERQNVYYDSLRWENYLDAQEDYEYLWLLDATLSYLKLHPELIPESKVKNMKEDLDTIVASVVEEKWVYTDHPGTMYSARYSIGQMLHELNNLINTTVIGEALWLPPFKPT